MRCAPWRDGLPLFRFLARYCAVAFVVAVSWNLVMNDDEWSTALSHGAMFTVCTFGAAMFWFQRRAARRAAGSAPGVPGR